MIVSLVSRQLILYTAGGIMECDQGTAAAKTPISIETYCLTLPGRGLHLPSLLLAKKFQNRGNKDGALAAFRKLESEGLGTLLIKK